MGKFLISHWFFPAGPDPPWTFRPRGMPVREKNLGGGRGLPPYSFRSRVSFKKTATLNTTEFRIITGTSLDLHPLPPVSPAGYP
jgi:hypothetical protein